MAELFVGPIMDKIINTCFEYLQDQFNMKDKLERLRENHPKIQAVVFAASQAQITDQNPALNKWMWQLRDAIDEADDLLDDFDYMKHKEHLAINMEETKVRSFSSFLYETTHKLRKVGECVFKTDSNLKRLEEVVQKLDKVSGEVSTFLHLLEITKQVQQEQQLELHKIRETGSLPKTDLIGRGKDKEFVIQWLRESSNEEPQTHFSATTLYNKISLLSIVSHGGMGKTTLLQHIFEDEMTREFDLKMWVCVSHNFDVKKVIADMLESLKMNRPSLESLDALQNSLRSEVMSKKFLLVLDDIWEEEEERDKIKWENVLAPLTYGSLGSKILITTRMDSVALMVAKVIKKRKEMLILKGLEEDECLQLLNIHAFADVENQDDHKKLRSITRELVKKLFGSPLAAKVMGGVLNSSLDERHWTNVLNSDLGHNDIFPILKLSYIFLPKYLQNCFAFCSIFTQDHVFDKDDLVRMWIAVGFIQPSCIRGEAVEDIGRRYFDVLVKKSLFDKDGTKYYKMHDLLHELAQSISAQECFRVVGDENLLLGLPKTIRHLSVQTSNVEVLRNLGEFKNLRTLMITYYKYDQDFVDVLAEIFKVTRSIRLLVIFDSCLKIVPETIGYLIHLRYLRLNFRFDILLPRSISNLYHLQFLICKDYTSHLPDDFFPRDMNNLSNLRYLSFPNWLKFRLFSFPGIGKLKFLQELKVFDVKNETGYRIGELKPMNDLRILGIKGLENIEDAEEACSAKLCDKKNLRDLSLEWGDIHDRMGQAITRNFVDSDLDVRVLNNLQPHNYLRNLKMVNYMGVKSAIWMSKAHLINNLECIDLYICLEWRNLPPFGQLPFLKSLRLLYMPKAKRFDNKFHGNDMCCCFPSLEKLYIENLEALEDWFDARVDCLFPCLTELFLKGCPNLQELLYLPPKLEILEIHKIGWKTLNCCGISKSIPLKTLEVHDCPNITHIFLASEIGGVAALRYVIIQNCPNLIYFGGNQGVETTGNCSNLKLNDLTISDPSVLQMEPLGSVTSIKSLTSLTSLQIEIYDVPQLREIRDPPPSLRILSLNSLGNLN